MSSPTRRAWCSCAAGLRPSSAAAADGGRAAAASGGDSSVGGGRGRRALVALEHRRRRRARLVPLLLECLLELVDARARRDELLACCERLAGFGDARARLRERPVCLLVQFGDACRVGFLELRLGALGVLDPVRHLLDLTVQPTIALLPGVELLSALVLSAASSATDASRRVMWPLCSARRASAACSACSTDARSPPPARARTGPARPQRATAEPLGPPRELGAAAASSASCARAAEVARSPSRARPRPRAPPPGSRGRRRRARTRRARARAQLPLSSSRLPP